MALAPHENAMSQISYRFRPVPMNRVLLLAGFLVAVA
jgi:hypothetical protein